MIIAIVEVQVLFSAPKLKPGLVSGFVFGEVYVLEPPRIVEVRTASGSSEKNLPMKATLSIVKFGGRETRPSPLQCITSRRRTLLSIFLIWDNI